MKWKQKTQIALIKKWVLFFLSLASNITSTVIFCPSCRSDVFAHVWNIDQSRCLILIIGWVFLLYEYSVTRFLLCICNSMSIQCLFNPLFTDEDIRNGQNTQTQNYNQINNLDEGRNSANQREQNSVQDNRGLHEPFKFYDNCYVRERNAGTYVSVQ